MAPHSNDAPYCPLPSYKKLETFNDQFPRKCKKPKFLTLNPRWHLTPLPVQIANTGSNWGKKFWRKENFMNLQNWFAKIISSEILKAGGGSGVKKKVWLMYIKVQPVMGSIIFTELQNLRLWQKYDTSKFRDIGQSHTKYRGIKWPKTFFFQYFQKCLSLSVQTCPKVRFYQVLHVSVSFVCRNDDILKIWAKNGPKSSFFTKMRFSKIT